jgi:very-short-patch-repair endonuclease
VRAKSVKQNTSAHPPYKLDIISPTLSTDHPANMSHESTNNLHKPWRAIASHHQRACQLRQESTPAEALLWQHLRNQHLMGLKFRRQHPIGRLIVDFYCPERKIAIEVNGIIHDRQLKDDQERDLLLNDAGIHVLRLPNQLILNNINQAFKRIIEFCNLSH